jgi:hypothetical protein
MHRRVSAATFISYQTQAFFAIPFFDFYLSNFFAVFNGDKKKYITNYLSQSIKILILFRGEIIQPHA